jgi:hypothetical protein
MFDDPLLIIELIYTALMGMTENNMDCTECIGRVVKSGLILDEQDICIDENSTLS